MPTSAGTPTVWEKLGAALGFGASIGMTPDQIAATLAGDQRDLTKGEQELVSIFQPILNQVETQGLADLAVFLKAILGAIPQITSVSHGVSIVNAALQAEGSTLQQQAISIGESGLITLISAALSAVGKVNLPLVG